MTMTVISYYLLLDMATLVWLVWTCLSAMSSCEVPIIGVDYLYRYTYKKYSECRSSTTFVWYKFVNCGSCVDISSSCALHAFSRPNFLNLYVLFIHWCIIFLNLFLSYFGNRHKNCYFINRDLRSPTLSVKIQQQKCLKWTKASC